MSRDDVRSAVAMRDAGMRKIGRYTWRAGAVGAAASALIAVAFGHHVAHSQPAHHRPGSSIIVPAAPPGPASGSGQATSGAS
jgi:hypothetical protein